MNPMYSHIPKSEHFQAIYFKWHVIWDNESATDSIFSDNSVSITIHIILIKRMEEKEKAVNFVENSTKNERIAGNFFFHAYYRRTTSVQ